MLKILSKSYYIVLVIIIIGLNIGAKAEELHQIPTVAIPTVTGTPSGVTASVTMEHRLQCQRGL